MSHEIELAGFAVVLEDQEAVCRFAVVDDPTVNPPPDPEEAFRREMQPGGRLAGKQLVISLEDTPAMSSRQLGSLLAIHRAWGGRGKLTVRGVRPNVRELFDMTKMGQFFEY